MTEITFTITQKELRKHWSEQCTSEEYIEMFENVSKAYGSWYIDLQVAEYIINKLRTQYFSGSYNENSVPEVLRPLVTEAIKNDFVENNSKNQDLTIDDVSDEFELEAIERLREFEYLSYDDAVQLFCDACEFAQENMELEHRALSEYSIEELLAEIRNRC